MVGLAMLNLLYAIGATHLGKVSWCDAANLFRQATVNAASHVTLHAHLHHLITPLNTRAVR
jgi:hypothetical protein